MSKELAADYFSRHTSDECHITSDERVFHTKGAADSFAAALKDDKVTSYTRAEIEAENFEVVESDEDKPKEYTAEDLKAFNAETADYATAKSLVKGLGLEAKSQKHPDLLEAIATAKAALEPQA